MSKHLALKLAKRRFSEACIIDDPLTMRVYAVQLGEALKKYAEQGIPMPTEEELEND